MTKIIPGEKGEGKIFPGTNSAITAYDFGELSLRAKIKVLPKDTPKYVEFGGKPFETSVGRLLFNTVLPKEYPDFDFSKMKIYLLEGTDKVLGTMSSTSSTHSKKYLEEMGVLVKTKTMVKDYDGQNVLLQDGTVITSALVIWAAGVKGSILKGINKEMITRDNRIKVDNFNKIQDTVNIFVLGDLAFMESVKYPKGYPQLATVAMDQAKNLAKNFKYVAMGKLVREYKFHNKGSMATVGRNKAVVDFEKPHISFQGFFAWIIWMTVHLFFLIGIKNKLVVFINWIYQYFTRSESFSLLFYPLLRKK
ncbi:MAG: FAD-dependent oxidoreductase [Bacteroidetes bacterium]|nr:FAD-dependent oxidoreductase [Bacteroidota bacterium]